MKNNVSFRYGVLCERLEVQANKQGYTLGRKAEKFEKIREAINMCSFHVATDKQSDMMRNKLNKKVVDALQPINKN